LLVLADGQALQNPTTAQRGIGRYVAEFATAVEQNHPGTVQGWVLQSDLPLPVQPTEVVRRGRFRLNDDPDLPMPDVWHILSPFESLMSPIEQVWPSWARASRTRLVVTLYDLIPLVYADHYLSDGALRRAYLSRLQVIERADRVLAISQASADDAMRLLHVPASKITVVGTGVSEHFVPPTSVAGVMHRVQAAVPGIRPGYVMYTGGIDFRKNIDGLLLAYSKLPARLRHKHQMVIVCGVLPAERRHLEKQAHSLGVFGDFLLTGFVPDDVLLALYQAAHLFVFPSLYEGFGLPVVEALSCGVPAIVGSNSSLTELVPDPRARFDASSVDAISRALFTALSSEPARDVLKQSILRKDYRWNVVAERSMSAYAAVHHRTTKNLARPRIALISPMPPAPTGVADYSAQLLRELSARVTVDVFTAPGSDEPRMTGVTWFNYADFDVTLAVRGPYEACLFAMGNSEYHVEVLRILRRAGGTVLSHDARYSGLMGVLLKEFPDLIDEDSARTVRNIDAGYRPDRHREHVSLPVRDYYALNGLLTGAALQGATRVLVHSGMAAMLARGNMPSDRRHQVAVVPFGHTIREVRDREHADAVVSLGLVDRIKSSDLVCAAFITLAHKYPLLTFAIVGELWDKAFASELAELVRAAGLGDRIVLTGRVSSGTYERWLSRARVAVQLRARSNGETSAAIADCLGAGVPVIASNTGSMAQLPDVCRLVSPDITADDLVNVIEGLLAGDEDREFLAANGRKHAEANTFGHAASAILEAAGVIATAAPH